MLNFFITIRYFIYDRYFRHLFSNNGRTLLFSHKNPFVYSPPILKKLGKIYFIGETKLTASLIIEYVKKNKIDRVLFHNPYANQHRLSLYNSVKSHNIPYIISERGALNDSIFFDWNGFNATSSSYDERNWNIPLSANEKNYVNEYINSEKSTSESLEYQPKMKKLDQIKEELKIEGKKVLFVPLQRLEDTVIKYFCGDVKNYGNFLDLVNNVSKHLPDDWIVVAKKHPLEDSSPQLHNVVFSDDNIKDLIDLSTYVLLINSGVGVLSMLWNKPVLYAGDVFYNHDDINRKVASYNDVLSILDEGFHPNEDTTHRFLYFLLSRFYSFGKFTTREVEYGDRSKLTITTAIDFYQIKNLDVDSHY